jgi:hypothetical protein
VGVFELKHLVEVFDFGSQQVAVLVTDFGRRSFEMHVGPAAFLKAVCRTIFGRRFLGGLRRCFRRRRIPTSGKRTRGDHESRNGSDTRDAFETAD